MKKINETVDVRIARKIAFNIADIINDQLPRLKIDDKETFINQILVSLRKLLK